MEVLKVCILPIFIFHRIDAVPPAACFAKFRWDDCGRSPTPVMYYWKLGSRCEVGLWRGCLPNLNMFQDEYECVATCIFTSRVMPEDYESINENEIEDITDELIEATTEVVGIEESASNMTTISMDNGTTIEDTNDSTKDTPMDTTKDTAIDITTVANPVT